MHAIRSRSANPACECLVLLTVDHVTPGFAMHADALLLPSPFSCLLLSRVWILSEKIHETPGSGNRN